MKRILTYGTFDLLHWGHIRLLKRARAMGDYLIVGASTEEFIEMKGNRAPYHEFEVRRSMLQAVRYVDLVIPEATWEQKVTDVKRYHADVVVMGKSWENSPSVRALEGLCQLVFLERTTGVSTTQIRRDMLTDAVTFNLV